MQKLPKGMFKSCKMSKIYRLLTQKALFFLACVICQDAQI